jgi:hypothetical protein
MSEGPLGASRARRLQILAGGDFDEVERCFEYSEAPLAASHSGNADARSECCAVRSPGILDAGSAATKAYTLTRGAAIMSGKHWSAWLGVVCIGKTHERAEALYSRTVQVLDAEAIRMHSA